MNDLVDKFFSADMSLGEEESLDELLSSSPEAANRFAEKAAAAYARYGLPDLGPDANPGKNTGWRFRLGLLLCVLALAGGFGWWRHSQKEESSAAPSSSLGGGSLSPSKQPLELKAGVPSGLAFEKSKAAKKIVPDSIPLSRNPEGLSGPRVPAVVPIRSAASVAGGGKTQEGSSQPGLTGAKGYSRLKIKVAISQAGPVTVCILDSAGASVKEVYEGYLPAGERSFTWDGRLENGQRALPGEYQIKTLSGGQVQTQEFQIEQKKKIEP